MKKSKSVPSVQLKIRREQPSPRQEAAWLKFWKKLAEVKNER